ncbi:hypothetical protein CGMCC3_g17829 [Colletotrichum fructicola]|nr:uncharacterized protein CGMCC3_g17829 [Colletotrichum fructicola]KAE9565990.1 hypothetical protein CGMCC3_g17829 [Colletotrichum fructicola]
MHGARYEDCGEQQIEEAANAPVTTDKWGRIWIRAEGRR